ncbi:hypothetical protein RHMOL_Rhmol05G0266500 [Rhododendron molle]|nr:hypothetical protein RHMOL_Rhmol05G0266500 [Rhododendron molle]
MVVAEVPKLASAAEYFFKLGVEGKRFRPMVLLLMATALNVHIPGPPDDAVVDALSEELRKRQQRIAEITEMIHVRSFSPSPPPTPPPPNKFILFALFFPSSFFVK